MTFGHIISCACSDKNIFQVEIMDCLNNVSSGRYFQTFLQVLGSKYILSGPVFVP
jgi:hypothetical protein